MKCTNYFAFVHTPCCSCKDIMQPDRLWSVPSKASVFFRRYPLHRLHVRLLFCLKSTVQKMQSSLWYPWEINLFRWTTTVFIYFLASCWWTACTAGGCFRLQTGRQAGIYFCCSNWKRKKMGREETKQVKEWKFNQAVLLKVWLGEGWIYSCLAFPLSTHHVSLQLLTSLLSLTHFCVCVFVCACKGLSICVSDVSFGLEANDVYVTATFCSRLRMLFCSLVSFIHFSCCLSNPGKVAVQNNNLLLYLWPKSIWQRYSRC